jgi:acylphosphatase
MENNPLDEIVRVHILVKGRVQAVGFRAHVEYHALQIGVLGWVRNVGKDSVEAVAEGKRSQIEWFVDIVKKGPTLARVDNAEVEYGEALGELTGFSVKKGV